MIGQIFGRLTVLEYAGTNKHRAKRYLCECVCGTRKVINGEELRNGRTVSCGCFNREIVSRTHRGSGNFNFKHGGKGTPLYSTWRGIVGRCCDPKNISYPHYGAKGITVCPEWRSDFGAFREWAIKAGWAEGLSIDRIDSNGNYSPSNCQWISRSENIAKSNRERAIKNKSRQANQAARS